MDSDPTSSAPAYSLTVTPELLLLATSSDQLCSVTAALWWRTPPLAAQHTLWRHTCTLQLVAAASPAAVAIVVPVATTLAAAVAAAVDGVRPSQDITSTYEGHTFGSPRLFEI